MSNWLKSAVVVKFTFENDVKRMSELTELHLEILRIIRDHPLTKFRICAALNGREELLCSDCIHYVNQRQRKKGEGIDHKCKYPYSIVNSALESLLFKRRVYFIRGPWTDHFQGRKYDIMTGVAILPPGLIFENYGQMKIIPDYRGQRKYQTKLQL